MEYIKSLAHPSEISALVKFKYAQPKESRTLTPNVQWCYDKLVQTSRSFSIVIQKLHVELRDAVMVFYLALRALDSVEDDMSFPTDVKIVMLRQFHEFLLQPGWTLDGCGEKEHERDLLRNFDKLIDVYSSLKEGYQRVIKDITFRMGNGMAEFAERGRVDSVTDWNKYCHYVAGLVGIGLSQLFYVSELEGEWFEKSAEVPSNSMGLFLQKTNIIRDYREDIEETRIFWPKEIWSMYTKKLENFKEEQYRVPAVQCLNHLITNALEHVPDVLSYLSHVREPSVFNFCAIPQVMAIATLAVCFNNQKVFTSIVKIRRGETAKIFNSITDIKSVHILFYQFVDMIEKKIDPKDPSAARTQEIVKKIKSLCADDVPSGFSLSTTELVLGTVTVAASLYLAYVVANTIAKR